MLINIFGTLGTFCKLKNRESDNFEQLCIPYLTTAKPKICDNFETKLNFLFIFLMQSSNVLKPRRSCKKSLPKRPVQVFGVIKQGRLLSAQARESFQIFFLLGSFDEHAVFGEVEFDNLNFKRKAFINTLSTCQVEHFAIKRNSIWRQIRFH